MTSTQQGLAGACCVASAVLALLAPGILHNSSNRGDTAALAGRTAPQRLDGSTAPTANSAHQGVPTSSVPGVPAGQASGTRATSQIPAPVTSLALVSNTWTSGTVAWSGTAARYRVLVGGHVVRDGAGTSITVRWPADGSNLLVQVAAVDAHGRLGAWRSLVVVPVRPSASHSQRTHHQTTGEPTSPAGEGTASQTPQAPASQPASPSAPTSVPASTAPTTEPSASTPAGSSGEAASTAPIEVTPRAQVNTHVSTDTDAGTTGAGSTDVSTRGDATTTATATPVDSPAN